MVGIYKITNNKNGKIYVGQSIDIYDRWKQHKYKAFNSKEKGYNSAIHLAFRKYGIENFSFEVIEECQQDKLDEKEQYWIKKLNSLSPNGYNILLGGQKNRQGKIWYCKECGLQISSKSTYCKKCYQEIHNKTIKVPRENRPSPLELGRMVKKYGFEKTAEQFNVTSNAVRKWCKNYNIPYHTKELVKWYNDQIGIKTQKTPKTVTKQIKQIDKNTNEIIAIYNSCRKAGEAIGHPKNYSHICEVCNGLLKSAYGYKWEYI